jgi:hypothetical protein
MSETHDHITAQLSGYLDDELTAAERTAVDAHLAGCPGCRSVLDDLRTIVRTAARLPESTPRGELAVDRELWDGIAHRVASGARAAPFPPRSARRFSFTLPQLAAAGILLMLMSGALVYLARPAVGPADVAVTMPDPAMTGDTRLVNFADPQYDGAVADLERTLELGRSRLDPETVRVLEQNLSAIDAAIEQSRRALDADPANAFLSHHLVSARQRKLALLRRATALTTGS